MRARQASKRCFFRFYGFFVVNPSSSPTRQEWTRGAETHRSRSVTLPDTTRASFGPTVWQFPILPAEIKHKTKIFDAYKLNLRINTFLFALDYRCIFFARANQLCQVERTPIHWASAHVLQNNSTVGVDFNVELLGWRLRFIPQAVFSCAFIKRIKYPSLVFCPSSIVGGCCIQVGVVA